MLPFLSKMHQNCGRLGLRPRPHWRSLQRSPTPLAVWGWDGDFSNYVPHHEILATRLHSDFELYVTPQQSVVKENVSAQQSWKFDCTKILNFYCPTILKCYCTHRNLENVTEQQSWNNFVAKQSWIIAAQRSWNVTAQKSRKFHCTTIILKFRCSAILNCYCPTILKCYCTTKHFCKATSQYSLYDSCHHP